MLYTSVQIKNSQLQLSAVYEHRVLQAPKGLHARNCIKLRFCSSGCIQEKTVLSSIQWQITQNSVVPLYSLTELIEIKIIDVRFCLESYRLRGLKWGLRKGWGVKEVINQDRKRFVIALEQVQLVPSSGDNLTFFSFHPENQTSRCNRPILAFPNGHFGSLPKKDSSRFELEVVLRSFRFQTLLFKLVLPQAAQQEIHF